MISFLSRLFRGRDLGAVLNETRKVRVHGVVFTIKKISPLDYLDGSQVMLQYYDEYKKQVKGEGQLSDSTVKKMRAHFRDVFVNAVVHPKIVREISKDQPADPAAIPVEHLFTDMGLANDLYVQIMAYANGKKKL